MTDDSLGGAVWVAAEPQLFVADIAAACGFYAGKLGFTVAFIYGDKPFYAQVARDGARLNLRCVAAPPMDPVMREREELLAATITVCDVGALFAEYVGAAASLHRRLDVEEWGARTFVARGFDGNLILFAGGG